jgi:hypothetical protein
VAPASAPNAATIRSDPAAGGRLVASVIRPGPERIDAGACPGGVVLHVYSATTPPVLVLSRRYRTTDAIETMAATDATIIDAMPDVGAVCLVGYDGDTGERFDLAGWFARG